MSTRFKMLREIYQMTLDNLSSVASKRTPCFSISRAAIATWESEKKMPTLDKLKTYSAIFGISIDWLAEISNTPYTISSIQYGEQYLFNQYAGSWNEHANQVSGINVPYLDLHEEFQKVKWDYIYLDSREKNFSLEVRANILVILGLLDSIPDISKLLLQKKLSKSEMQKEQEKLFYPKITLTKQRYQTYHDNLLKLLSTNKTSPIYVIE